MSYQDALDTIIEMAGRSAKSVARDEKEVKANPDNPENAENRYRQAVEVLRGEKIDW